MRTLSKDIKDLVECLFAAIYAAYLGLSGRKNQRVVLYYHGIEDSDVGLFEKQIAYLTQNYTVIEPSAIKTASANSAKGIVSITFDDGYASVLDNAVPILRKYACPAAFSFPAGCLGQRPRWPMPHDCSDKNEIVMERCQIAELERGRFEIFSHTVSHPVLTEAEDNRLKSELADSKNRLEQLVGHPILAISYPYGRYDLRVCEAAREVGYRLGFTIEPRIVDSSTDDMQIGRFAVSPQDSLFKFKLKISGAYQAARFSRSLKSRIVRCLTLQSCGK